MKPWIRALTGPLRDDNPVTVQLLGICSALAVTRTVDAALAMSAALGVVLLKLLSAAALDVLMSVMVILGVLIVVTHASFRRTSAREFIAGVASGTMAMVSAIGGPPIALLYRNDAGPTVRANLGLVFAIGLCITISVRAAAGEVSWDEVAIGAALLPAVLLGLSVSRVLIPRVDGPRLRNAIVLVAGVAASMLLVRGLLSA